MPSNDATRSVIVDALDELGERNKLTYAQRTASDEPYPSSVVADRLESLRRSQRILRILLVILGVAVTLLLGGADVGWTLPGWLVGFELLPLLPPVVFAVYKLAEEAKAEQLYALLARLEETAEPRSESTVPEAA